MKPIILILMLCASVYAKAQQITPERSITVHGTVEKPLDDVMYKTEVTLSLEKGYYGDGPYKTLDELLAKYYEEVKSLNIDTSKFIRDDLAFAAMGYRTEGTVLRYETKSKKDILKLTNIKMSQVMPSYVQVKSKIFDAEIKLLTQKALENARKNAELLAEVSGEEIDKLFSISSYDLGEESYWRAANSGTEYLRLTVVYTLKD
ncbi:hypothetical protein KO504_00965 [Winogradskyella psychrotolerans]|uniref:hypothetical protein n=1 Tax=Winogradskyella psychrotolerans TaxID=1344585 RepID=UPI001C076DA5|nr:hypothetical protein [Winogradskyella psychrotolerans]MBU2919898.1 hypothetical protein [Winogradskyella psychrotolerans]